MAWPAADTRSYARVFAALAEGYRVWRIDGGDGGQAFAVAADESALPGTWRAAAVRISPPRVAVYASWKASSDEGWLRYVLDRFGQPFAVLRDADIRRGDLGGCSHLILPSLRGRDLLHGLPEERYAPAYSGGLGERGRDQLLRWTAGGGRLLAVEWAAAWAATAFDLPVQDATLDPSAALYVPGALLGVAPCAGPLAFGAPARTWVMYRGGPALRVEPGAAAAVFGREPPAAGLADGVAALAGTAAVADVPVGRGRCRLYAFSPYFRAQAWASFRWLFNGLLS